MKRELSELDAHAARAASSFQKPYDEVRLPPSMRSVPLSFAVQAFLPAFRFTSSRCEGVALADQGICVVASTDGLSRERSLFVAKKAAFLLELLSLPLTQRPDVVIKVVRSPSSTEMAEAFVTTEDNAITIDESWLFSNERSSGVLLHELVHVIEEKLRPEFRRELRALYNKELSKLLISPGVVIEEPKTSFRSQTFNYPSWFSEFLSCSVEAWFNATSREHLTLDRQMTSLRVARNRAELWELYPEVATFLSNHLTPYDYDNKEIDAYVMKWNPDQPSEKARNLARAALRAMQSHP
jgi:hypothetical protein